MSRALHIKANGEVAVIDIPTTDGHTLIHHKVGGWFDVVQLRDKNIHAYVHDTGLIEHQPVNCAVSMWFKQILCGDVVVSALNEDDGAEMDLDEVFCSFGFITQCREFNTNEDIQKQFEQIVDRNPDWEVHFDNSKRD